MNYIAERRLEEKDRRRSEILSAAELVAASAGIDALTMDQVARQARISRALLYVYFRDKGDLHLGLCEHGLEILRQRFEAAAARHATGLLQLEAIGRAYVAFAQEFPVYFEALARFQASDAKPAGAQGHLSGCLEMGDKVHQIIMQSVAAGQKDRSVSSEAGTPAAVAMTLWGFMHGIIQLITTKSYVVAAYGLSSKSLVDEAMLLATRGLATTPANSRR
jgi:AcrR family transcriptional regulator